MDDGTEYRMSDGMKWNQGMLKVVIAFVLGILVGLALGAVVFSEAEQKYSGPQDMEQTGDAFDGSNDAIRKGRKYMVP